MASWRKSHLNRDSSPEQQRWVSHSKGSGMTKWLEGRPRVPGRGDRKCTGPRATGTNGAPRGVYQTCLGAVLVPSCGPPVLYQL